MKGEFLKTFLKLNFRENSLEKLLRQYLDAVEVFVQNIRDKLPGKLLRVFGVELLGQFRTKCCRTDARFCRRISGKNSSKVSKVRYWSFKYFFLVNFHRMGSGMLQNRGLISLTSSTFIYFSRNH